MLNPLWCDLLMAVLGVPAAVALTADFMRVQPHDRTFVAAFLAAPTIVLACFSGVYVRLLSSIAAAFWFTLLLTSIARKRRLAYVSLLLCGLFAASSKFVALVEHAVRQSATSLG